MSRGGLVPRWLALWGPVAAFLTLSFSVSSVPGDDLVLPFSDVLAHSLQFLVLGILLIRAFHGGMTTRPPRAAYLKAVAAALTWALADEFHQSFVPGRHAAATDVLADAVGALAACAVFPLLVPAAARVARTLRHGGAEAEALPVLTFLTRDGCHLCDEAWKVVERVTPAFRVRVEVVDVDSREELAREHGDSVPVLLVQGRRAFKFRIPEARLRRRLERWRVD